MGPYAARRKAPSLPSKPSRTEKRLQKRKGDHDDLATLETAVASLASSSEAQSITAFSGLPLSEPTTAGLRASHFRTLTDVQRHALPLALTGRDVLAAAKTGSGKTLAFLIPVLEKLYRARWTELNGLGALIISPTRELAVQIFQVLRKIGRCHAFSAGLVIGGKSLKEEAERLSRMNILVCTPGRMLQHLDQTAGLDANNLQVLVLDEADRIMDMGFQAAVDALIEHLPKTRQTLLFSATQSKRVSDLARLSLRDYEFVSVHEAAAAATPANLQQHYLVTPLPEKLDVLYGFLKCNLKSKILVFLSSGKQVRFVYESFRHLQPGILLLHLHGRQKQQARLGITSHFTAAKSSCLFATDVVARGIDFPAVDWVIQADCPEDVDTYIHRVGRTARYESSGHALLLLDPSEEDGMVRKLQQKKIPIQKVNAKEKKKREIKTQLQNMCFQNPNLKYLGQKAFISYTRAVHLQKDKDIFQLDKLDLDGFAASMGLPGTPQISFQKGEDLKKLKNASRAAISSGSEPDSDDVDNDGDEDAIKPAAKAKSKKEVRTKYDKMFERQNQDILSNHYSKLVQDSSRDHSQRGQGGRDNGDDDDEDDFLQVKRRLNDDDLEAEAKKAGTQTVKVIEGLGGAVPYVVDSKRREKALQSKKKMLKFRGKPTKLLFDDEGTPHAVYEMQDRRDFDEQGPALEQRRRFVEDEAARVREADVDDKEAARQRKREKRDRRRAREAAELAGDDGTGSREALPSLPDTGDGAFDGGTGARDDALALLRSLPLAGGADGGDDATKRQQQQQPSRKRARKWFEDDDDIKDTDGREEDGRRTAKRGKSRGRRAAVLEVGEQPETLEDLEALATGLLDG